MARDWTLDDFDDVITREGETVYVDHVRVPHSREDAEDLARFCNWFDADRLDPTVTTRWMVTILDTLDGLSGRLARIERMLELADPRVAFREIWGRWRRRVYSAGTRRRRG